MSDKILIGYDEGNYNPQFIFLEFDRHRGHIGGISAGFTTCDGLITESEGEAEAYNTLSEPDYWEEVGLLPDSSDNFLFDFIDFKAVAEHIISLDGWQNINGEWEDVGFVGSEYYYTSFSSWTHDIDDAISDCNGTPTLVIKKWEYNRISRMCHRFGYCPAGTHYGREDYIQTKRDKESVLWLNELYGRYEDKQNTLMEVALLELV